MRSSNYKLCIGISLTKETWIHFFLKLLLVLGMSVSISAHAVVREVRVGVYSNEPKIFVDREGHASGILIDILKAVAKQENWKLEFVQCEWSVCLQDLQDERIDLMPDIAYSDQRAETIDFNKVVVLHSWSEMYHRKGMVINSMLDLNGERIVVLNGSIQQEYLKNLLADFGVHVRLMTVNSLNQGFEMVEKDEADVAVANRFFGGANSERYNLTASPIMFQPSQLFYGTKHGKNADLLKAIDLHLADWVEQQGSPYFDVLKKWTLQPPRTVIPSWLYKGIGALATLLLIALLISAHLRRQVKEKTRHLIAGQEQLARSEEKLRSILDSVDAYIYLKDSQGRYEYVNKNVLQLLNTSLEEVVGSSDEKFFDANTAAAIRNNDNFVLTEGKTLKTEETNSFSTDGKTATFLTTKLPISTKDGQIYALCGISIDITDRKQAETDLRISAVSFESQESIMITNADREILRVNASFTRSTGYTAEEIVGKTPRILDSGRHNAEFYMAIWNSLNTSGAWQGEIWIRRKNGEIFPTWQSISAVKRDDGIITHYVGSHVDITERKLAEERIQHLAFYDHLTNLPNRLLLLDRLKQALDTNSRIRRAGALMFIDLDNFKNLNDTLGHDMGDLLLQHVTQRLESCIRKGDTVARLGGDEFVVMLLNLSEQIFEAALQAEAIGMKILAALRQPYQLDKNIYRCTASIGITLISDNQQTTEDLMKQADIAMYQAKKAGRNTLRFFDRQMQENTSARVSLESELQNALEYMQFHLHYQIQVDNTGHPLGAEALIRWIHPTRGMVSPAQFIPLTEESGLILSIGEWVLETACAQLKTWQNSNIFSGLSIAVNVSAKQFHQPEFVNQVQTIIQRHGINPNLLKMEITESMLLEDIRETIAIMQSLKQIGIRFSLDDFGTGYSSLQYLKELPLDQIKIDQSFVRDIATDPNDAAIVQTIIAIADMLGFGVIAEGVETEAQREFLESRGCRAYQGYLLGKPVPIEQFEATLMKI